MEYSMKERGERERRERGVRERGRENRKEALYDACSTLAQVVRIASASSFLSSFSLFFFLSLFFLSFSSGSGQSQNHGVRENNLVVVS